LASRLAGVRRLVVSDAGCALTMRVRYGEVGTRLPEQLEVVHLVELAARALPDVPRLDAPFLRRIRNGGVRYHDACALGRGLGVYAAPRALLTRLLGAAPHEFARHGVEARCAGGGGILPSTDRPTADAIAAARVDEHLDEGGGAIATTCASSRKSLARGGRARVFDVTTLLARAFERGER
jgi:Fe-S oxidoreductase